MKKYTSITTISGKTRYIVGDILEENNNAIKIESVNGFVMIVSKLNIAKIDRA